MKNFLRVCLLILFGASTALYSQSETNQTEIVAADGNRSGGYFGFGLGPGWLGGNDFSVREKFLYSFVRFGTKISDRVSAGLEIDRWDREAEYFATGAMVGVNAVAYFYPDPLGGMYLKAGMGLATPFDFDAQVFDSVDDYGFSSTLGIGFDMGFLALSPYAGFQFYNYPDGSLSVLSAGLSFAWY